MTLKHKLVVVAETAAITVAGATVTHLTVASAGGHVTITGWHEGVLAGANAGLALVLTWLKTRKTETVTK